MSFKLEYHLNLINKSTPVKQRKSETMPLRLWKYHGFCPCISVFSDESRNQRRHKQISEWKNTRNEIRSEHMERKYQEV